MLSQAVRNSPAVCCRSVLTCFTARSRVAARQIRALTRLAAVMSPPATGVLCDLQPQPLFNLFEELSQVPRPSHHEERVLSWLIEFAKKNNLEWQQDEATNVVIRRPGSGGGEAAPAVALQSHVDMVTEKNNTKTFDFFSEGIQMLIDGEWVKADGTTLGADDGIGVATALALLVSPPTAKLPPLECLFTVTEEHGMGGAFGLGEQMLTAPYMLNLDAEDWGHVYCGSAGAGATIITLPVTTEPAPSAYEAFDILVRGLSGGHSGADIHKGFANSVIVTGQVLQEVAHQVAGVRIGSVRAGDKRNAIPREGTATVMVSPSDVAELKSVLKQTGAFLKTEYGRMDPDLNLQLQPASSPAADVLTEEAAQKLVALLTTLPNGVVKMSHAVPGLVETSNNVGYVMPVCDDQSCVPCGFRIETYARTMLDTWHLDAVRKKMKTIASLCGASVEMLQAYPGWAPNPDSTLLQITCKAVEEISGKPPVVEAIHAGLECGLISIKYPHMDIVSYGPTILGAHTPEERLSIPTVLPYWNATLKILETIADMKA